MRFIESTVGAPARLAEVARYNYLHPGLLAEMDDIAARSAVWTELPISLITVLTGDAQVCVGVQGLPAETTIGDRVVDRFSVPIGWAFCVPMIRSGHSLAMTDTRAVPELAANPIVSTLGLRGYLGTPLISDDGSVIGSHCVLSPAPFEARLTDVLALETGTADALRVLDRYRARSRRCPAVPVPLHAVG